MVTVNIKTKVNCPFCLGWQVGWVISRGNRVGHFKKKPGHLKKKPCHYNKKLRHLKSNHIFFSITQLILNFLNVFQLYQKVQENQNIRIFNFWHVLHQNDVWQNIFFSTNLLFFLEKSMESTISFCFLSSCRASEPANFQRLWLLTCFLSRLGSCLFFQAAPALKNPKTTGSPALVFKDLMYLLQGLKGTINCDQR